jgi:hypothetical protein
VPDEPERTYPDDVPTAPDLPFVTCPRCRGDREYMSGEDTGSTYVRIFGPCDTCRGPDGRPTGFVTQAGHAQFHADHGDEVETIPPPSSSR